MSYIYYITFISVVIVIGWIFRPVEEHMTNGTCKRTIYGPQGVDAEKCARVYPDVYGPIDSGLQNRVNGIKYTSTGRIRGLAAVQNVSSGTEEKSSGPVSEILDSATGEIRDSRTGEILNSPNGDLTMPSNTNAMYDDNGEFRSDTATRNAAYMNVFTFKPYAKMDFPTSGPPQPYLTDFATFHK